MNEENVKSFEWCRDLLNEALTSFNDGTDQRLLEDERADDGQSYGSVGECAISHRLAVHLECALSQRGYPNKKTPLSVDCEYNRHRGGIKKHHVKGDLKKRVEELKKRRPKKHPDKEGWYVFSVFPDVIIHHRGEDDLNLLAIELKRASNTFDDKLDNIKLHLFTGLTYESGYAYILGASVIAFDTDDHGPRRLKIGRLFIDGQCRYRAPFLADEPVTLPFLKTPECDATL